MLDHINIPVSNLQRSKALYQPLLTGLGLHILYEDEEVVGFGQHSWVLGIEQIDTEISRLHFALVADSNATVDAFHHRAMMLGATDNGAPGYRAEYGENYYAAFLIDPDGHNVEAVCRNIKLSENAN